MICIAASMVYSVCGVVFKPLFINRMVFSRALVSQLMQCTYCRCASADQPDDMKIGLWLKHLGVPVIHSPLFHQVIHDTIVIRIDHCLFI